MAKAKFALEAIIRANESESEKSHEMVIKTKLMIEETRRLITLHRGEMEQCQKQIGKSKQSMKAT